VFVILKCIVVVIIFPQIVHFASAVEEATITTICEDISKLKYQIKHLWAAYECA